MLFPRHFSQPEVYMNTRTAEELTEPFLPIIILSLPNVNAALPPTVRTSLKLAAAAFWTLKIIFSQNNYLL